MSSASRAKKASIPDLAGEKVLDSIAKPAIAIRGFLDTKDLSVIWLNDSAKAANWIPESSAHELKDIFSFIDDEAENQIKEILLQAKKNASAITRRDFLIVLRNDNFEMKLAA